MNETLQRGLTLLKNGQKAEALPFLAAAAREIPNDPQVWLALAAAVDDAQKKRECLKRALALQPDFLPAKNMLNRLEKESLPPLEPKPGAPSGASEPVPPSGQAAPAPNGGASAATPKPGGPSGVDGFPAAVSHVVPTPGEAALEGPTAVPPIDEGKAVSGAAAKKPAVPSGRKRKVVIALLIFLLLICVACLLGVWYISAFQY